MSEPGAEKALVDAAIAGDGAALELLLSNHFPALERHIRPRIPDKARRHLEVEDILQIVLAQAFRDIGKFQPRGDGAFLAWLRKIADNRLIDALRKLEREGYNDRLSNANVGDDNSVQELIDIVCQDSKSPSRNARNQEAIRAMRIAIASLAEDQQEVIRLHWFEHKGVEEIAGETGHTEAAVRGLLYRGQKKLAEAMGRASRWLSSG